MNYASYQIWFHSYNNAITAFGQGITVVTYTQIIEAAKKVADIALEKFKGVEPESAKPSAIDGFDLKAMVDQLTKDVMKNRGGK